jgi:carbonic anhydrase
VSVTDELLRNNAEFASSFKQGDLPMPPGKGLVVVACMDARLNVYALLGLREGQAHVIRNAGGVVTDAPWSSPSACSAPARSSSSTTPTAAC